MQFNFTKLFIWFSWIASLPLNAQLIVILDPAGHSKQTGRHLGQAFEFNLALQFAQALKQQVQLEQANLEIIIPKNSVSTPQQLQIASFSNRVQADLFISLNFYPESNVKPKIAIFYFKNQTFYPSALQYQLAFYPYHQAFVPNFKFSQQAAMALQKQLSLPQYKHYFQCEPVLALPFQPLCGVLAPAIAIEIGLRNDNWRPYVVPTANGILEMLRAIHQT